MDIDPKTQGVLIALIIVTFVFAVGYWGVSCGKPPHWTKVQLQ
jgi:hypothetical protein